MWQSMDPLSGYVDDRTLLRYAAEDPHDVDQAGKADRHSPASQQHMSLNQRRSSRMAGGRIYVPSWLRL